VAKDGTRIAGRRASGEAVIFDIKTQKMQIVPGVGAEDALDRWTEDGQALLVTASTRWDGQVYRVDVNTGKRSLLQKVDLADKAGSSMNLRVFYAESSKTYAYNVRRVLSSLYVVDGLD
jgi:hypothetical protein